MCTVKMGSQRPFLIYFYSMYTLFFDSKHIWLNSQSTIVTMVLTSPGKKGNVAQRFLNINFFFCSFQLSIKFVQLLNFKSLSIANSFLLNIAEHENFSDNKYENANYWWHFHIG